MTPSAVRAAGRGGRRAAGGGLEPGVELHPTGQARAG